MNNMDLWQGNITVSWNLQFFSLVFYAILILVILFAPWPTEFCFAWAILLVLAVISALLTQKRLTCNYGELIIHYDKGLKLHFLSDEWSVGGRPFKLGWFIFFKLKSTSHKRGRLLVLANDCMGSKAWHNLHHFLYGHTITREGII